MRIKKQQGWETPQHQAGYGCCPKVKDSQHCHLPPALASSCQALQEQSGTEKCPSTRWAPRQCAEARGPGSGQAWREPETCPWTENRDPLSPGVPLTSDSDWVLGPGKVRALGRGQEKQRLSQQRQVPECTFPAESQRLRLSLGQKAARTPAASPARPTRT